jgi:hypothetical protein
VTRTDLDLDPVTFLGSNGHRTETCEYQGACEREALYVACVRPLRRCVHTTILLCYPHKEDMLLKAATSRGIFTHVTCRWSRIELVRIRPLHRRG